MQAVEAEKRTSPVGSGPSEAQISEPPVYRPRTDADNARQERKEVFERAVALTKSLDSRDVAVFRAFAETLRSPEVPTATVAETIARLNRVQGTSVKGVDADIQRALCIYYTISAERAPVLEATLEKIVNPKATLAQVKDAIDGARVRHTPTVRAKAA